MNNCIVNLCQIKLSWKTLWRTPLVTSPNHPQSISGRIQEKHPLWLKSLSQPPSYQYWLNQERACFGSSNFHGFLLSKKAPREKADFFMDGEFLGANVISSNITTPHCGLGGECFRRQRNLKQYHHTALWLRIGVFLGANVI